jgi:hypothetical protein
MQISVIHPSRGRGRLAQDFVIQLNQKLSKQHQVEHILSIDTDDIGNYANFDDRFCNAYNVIKLVNDNKNHVQAVNAGAKIATGQLFVVTGEDFIYPVHWDHELYSAIRTKHDKDLVVWIRDGIQPRIMTLPILTKEYYNRFGYVYYPEYWSMFADTEFTEVAHKLGKVVDARHLLFRHNHYTIGGVPEDATYQKQNSKESWVVGERIFNERKANNFGI